MAELLKRDERNRVTNEAKFAEHDAMLKNHATSLGNLECHVGEIASQLSERAPGSLPSNTEKNPRGFAKEVTTRSGARRGKEAGPSRVVTPTVDEEDQVDEETQKEPPPAEAHQQTIPAILHSEFPEKMADPGSFTILCILGDDTVRHALADLGASINLMSYSVFSKLGLGEPRPTRMSIQLADRSVKNP
ncbi:uncharacterized protein LOC143561640 [Bidens hawaiensis]|uniref:uncharacterized protein LOC143561640 n=1 Tax=Bidens hawaiensis TaxID=980011 RepID=UPI00404A8EDA